MRSTARTGVPARNPDDADLSGKFLFTPVIDLFQFLGGRKSRIDLTVLPDDPVCSFLDLQKLLPLQQSIQVNGDLLRSHMKTDVIVTILRMDQSGDKMLAGMSLHIPKSSLPVDLASHGLTDGKRCVRIVDDLAILFVDCRYRNATEYTRIIRLSASLRKKCCLIQNYLISLFPFRAGKNLCLECADICGIII